MIYKKHSTHDNVYLNNGKQYTTKDLANMIRGGDTVYVMSKEGYDETKEFLVKAAFGKDTPKGLCFDYFIKCVPIEKLYDIVEGGGIDNFLMREYDSISEIFRNDAEFLMGEDI